MKPPILGIAGFKNSGKTTLAARLIEALSARNLVVSSVKHAHHAFDIDHPGRDSYRHRQAGAKEVAVVSQSRWAIVHELRGDAEPRLGDILEKLESCDIVITEGYKWEAHPKLEVRNTDLQHPELAGNDPTIIAIVANGPVAEARVPVFDRDDINAITDFVIRQFHLDPAS